MKTKNILRHHFLPVLLSFLPLVTTHAQTGAELPSRSAKHANSSDTWPQKPVRSAHGMIATDEPLGSQAGVEILKRGGNAIDAAVAVAFALAVVEPAAGNIGGGGFMLVRLADGKTNFFDYREVAPAKSTRDMYIKDGKLIPDASTLGYRSVAVPGTVAGLELALKTHGTMKLADVMVPAIRLAKERLSRQRKTCPRIGRRKARPAAIRHEQTHFSKQSPAQRRTVQSRRHFPPAGTRRYPQRIAANGAADFYRGETARRLLPTCTATAASSPPKISPAISQSFAKSSTPIINSMAIAGMSSLLRRPVPAESPSSRPSTCLSKPA